MKGIVNPLWLGHTVVPILGSGNPRIRDLYLELGSGDPKTRYRFKRKFGLLSSPSPKS